MKLKFFTVKNTTVSFKISAIDWFSAFKFVAWSQSFLFYVKKNTLFSVLFPCFFTKGFISFHGTNSNENWHATNSGLQDWKIRVILLCNFCCILKTCRMKLFRKYIKLFLKIEFCKLWITLAKIQFWEMWTTLANYFGHILNTFFHNFNFL